MEVLLSLQPIRTKTSIAVPASRRFMSVPP